MKKRWTWPALALFGLIMALLATGCSSSPGKKPESHTNDYDTQENLTAFQASRLYELADGFYQNRDTKAHGAAEPAVGPDEPAEAAPYIIDNYAPSTTPLEPFLAVAVRRDDEKNEIWNICGGSATEMDLSSVRTLAVCIIAERSAQYKGEDYYATGSTEDARILYIDAQTGEYLTESELQGKDLPNRAYNGVPKYTLSDGDLVAQVARDMTPPYTLTDGGEITGGKLSGMSKGYAFPANVKRITKLEIGEKVSKLFLPASVEAIADGVIPHACMTENNMDKPVVLTVVPGTYAETFAREGGYAYRHPEDDEETAWVWAAGCECSYYSTRKHSSRDEKYPLNPDGDLAAFMTLQRRSYMGKDAPTEAYFVLIVERGSPAEGYAQAHQYPYCYPEDEEHAFRFCIDGREWCHHSGNLIVIPDGVAADDATLV